MIRVGITRTHVPYVRVQLHNMYICTLKSTSVALFHNLYLLSASTYAINHCSWIPSSRDELLVRQRLLSPNTSNTHTAVWKSPLFACVCSVSTINPLGFHRGNFNDQFTCSGIWSLPDLTNFTGGMGASATIHNSTFECGTYYVALITVPTTTSNVLVAHCDAYALFARIINRRTLPSISIRRVGTR